MYVLIAANKVVLFKNKNIGYDNFITLDQGPLLLKGLNMVYPALWDRRHGEATGISPCTFPRGPWVPLISQCKLHHASIILWHQLVGYNKLWSQTFSSSEAGDGESFIVGNLCMVVWVTCIAIALLFQCRQMYTKCGRTYAWMGKSWTVVFYRSYVDNFQWNQFEYESYSVLWEIVFWIIALTCFMLFLDIPE